MVGWLVVNHCLQSKKFYDTYSWLIKTALSMGIDLQMKTNLILSPITNGNRSFLTEEAAKPDFVLFWDKDVVLANYLESLGHRLFNRSKAISLCDNKSLTHVHLSQYGIKMPKTILAPLTFTGTGLNDPIFVQRVSDELGYPMIVKESFGSFGEQVYLVDDATRLQALILQMGTRPFLCQEFIKSSRGRDIRINIVGNKVVAAMHRSSLTNDFRANITLGGTMKNFKPNAEQCKTALAAVSALELDFAGVDILFGENDEPILCEVNSNAQFINLFNCTGIDITLPMMNYIRNSVGGLNA